MKEEDVEQGGTQEDVRVLFEINLFKFNVQDVFFNQPESSG